MADDKDIDGVAQALRRGLRIGRARPEAAALPLEGRQALALAAYLDGTLTAAEETEVEGELLLTADRLEVLLVSRAALAHDPSASEPLPSDAVLQRAQALIREPVPAPAAGWSDKLGAWLKDCLRRPLRPALGAAAFAVYGLFCLQVFDWGLAGGEALAAAAEAEAAPAEAAFVLALDDMM